MLRFRTPGRGFTTRFAPAPTGFLHVGHVASAILVFGMARAFGGRVLLRIEDHDRVRSRPEFQEALLEDLHWLGFSDAVETSRQSDREEHYAAALQRLSESGLVYPCSCSRKSIESVASHAEGEIPYPGTCRRAKVDGAAHMARRVHLREMSIGFDDLRLGAVSQNPTAQCGDVLVRDRLGQWTYQFAVVVDDLEQGVDLVIRGEDLLESTGRQVQIARLLGRSTAPRFLHHALIKHPGGQKLSKSSGDTGVRDLRSAGWTPSRVLGAAAQALGLSNGEPLSIDDVGARVFAAGNA